MLSGQPLEPQALQDIQQIIPSVHKSIEKLIVHYQTELLATRRTLTNKLCAQKCQSGPAVHNFTALPVPPEILKLIGPGLHVVPCFSRPPNEVSETIVSDLRNAAIAYFRATMGHYPSGADQDSGWIVEASIHADPMWIAFIGVLFCITRQIH